MLKFHANTFFEQYKDDPWLKSREPWYSTTQIDLEGKQEEIEVTSITVRKWTQSLHSGSFN